MKIPQEGAEMGPLKSTRVHSSQPFSCRGCIFPIWVEFRALCAGQDPEHSFAYYFDTGSHCIAQAAPIVSSPGRP